MAFGALLGAGLGIAGGLLGAKKSKARFQPFDINTGFGSVDATQGGLTTNLDPRFQAISDQLLGQAGGLFGQLQGDPSIAADDLFQQAQALVAPEQARARASNASQLFAQGQLGSTGGALRTGALEGSIADAQSQLALQSIFDAQRLQDQLLNRGLAAQSGSLQLEQLPMGLLNASLSGGQGRLQGDMFSAQQSNARNQQLGSMLSSFGGGLFRGAGGFGG